jgi:hypothetical protein
MINTGHLRYYIYMPIVHVDVSDAKTGNPCSTANYHDTDHGLQYNVETHG